MKIETRFGPGDRIWVTSENEPIQRTVGQVRACVTDTPGLDLGDGIKWDNFKARREYVEEYMCVETGVDSGSVYTLGKHAFATREEAASCIREVQEQLEREENARRLRRQIDAVQGLLARSPMLEFARED